VIFDTLADVFAGNQNDAHHVRQFMNIALGGLARDIDGSVMLLGHPSQSGMSSGLGYSGSVQWQGAPRGHLSLEKKKAADDEAADGKSRPRVLKRLKGSYAEGDEKQIELFWEDGILKPRGGARPSRPDCTVVFMTLLDQFTAQGRPVSQKPTSGNYAPRVFAEHHQSQGWNKAQFKKAMDQLFDDGVIVQRPYGKDEYLRIERREPAPELGQRLVSDQGDEDDENLVSPVVAGSTRRFGSPVSGGSPTGTPPPRTGEDRRKGITGEEEREAAALDERGIERQTKKPWTYHLRGADLIDARLAGAPSGMSEALLNRLREQFQSKEADTA
jgi:hypothetical protein